MQSYVTVIGGINIDIKGVPYADLRTGTSNPGRISLSAGGVGRNIAHNLVLLDVPAVLLGAVGDDGTGRDVLAETEKAGVDTSKVLKLAEIQTGTYLSILDQRHELAVAVSDMEICRWVTPAYLEQHRSLLLRSRVIVAETNLETAVLAYISELCAGAGIPLLIEPVSIEKAKKLREISVPIDWITPNLSELEALAGQPLAEGGSLDRLCASLSGNFSRLLITRGEHGVYFYDTAANTGKQFPAIPTQVADVNGAGDAFVAGVVCGLFRQYLLDRSIHLGIAAASLTLQTEHTVNNHLTLSECLGFCV